MNSLTRPSFWRGDAKLDSRVKQAACEAYSLISTDPDHPSLRFKKLQGYENVRSVRMNEQYRAVGERNDDTIALAWIGSHNEFDSKFRQFDWQATPAVDHLSRHLASPIPSR